MAAKPPQNFSNHTRLDPAYHFFLLPVFLFTVIMALVQLFRHPDGIHAWFVVFAIAVLILCFKARMYALKVQDRLIRMEERVRLSALLSEPLRAQISGLKESQLVALRFASDEEVAALAEKTLRGNLVPKAIKQSIRNWRPDYWRV